ncbi:MAG: HIT family protein [Candidatus Woesearchaeota archaeon]
MPDDCIFCKIINGEIPSSKLYEDDLVYAFLDIQPVNRGHTLIIPKEHHKDLLETPEETIDAMFRAVKKVAPAVIRGVNADGFNLGMNNKEAAGQVVFHAHLHIVPRFKDDGLKLWPGGKYDEGEAERIKESITKEL